MALSDLPAESATVALVVRSMSRRSVIARMSAWASIAIMTALAVFVLYLFSDSAGYYTIGSRIFASFADRSETDPSERKSLKETISELEAKLQKAESAKTKDQLDSEVKLAALEVDKLKLRSEQDRSLQILGAITSSITRVGAVMIALYLIQILLGVMRYCFRMADHFACAANATQLSVGRPKGVKELLDVLSPSHVDFGKAPATPASDIKDAVDKIASKLADVIRPKSEA